jgi:hypothetical protein
MKIADLVWLSMYMKSYLIVLERTSPYLARITIVCIRMQIVFKPWWTEYVHAFFVYTRAILESKLNKLNDCQGWR